MQLFGRSIFTLLDDFKHANSLWQIAGICVCLLIAWILSKFLIKFLDKRENNLNKLTLSANYATNSLRKAIFPLLSWLLVLLARWMVAPHINVYLFTAALAPLLGLGVLYLTFFMARKVLGISNGALTLIKLIEKILIFIVSLIIIFYVFGILDDFLYWLSSLVFSFGPKHEISLFTILGAIVWILLTMVVALFINSAISERLELNQNLELHLKAVLLRLIKVILISAALIISLNLVGIDLTALSVFGGALGVALGFGMQKIASNYVSGFIILLDRSLRLGNLISVDKYIGVVTEICTRYTVLHLADDTEVLVPNELIIANIMQNYSYSQNILRLSIQIEASYKDNPQQVLNILSNAAKGVNQVLVDPEPKAFLLKFADSGIIYELAFWIKNPELGSLGIKSAVNLAVWQAFHEHGIEIPYPQREVRILNTK